LNANSWPFYAKCFIDKAVYVPQCQCTKHSHKPYETGKLRQTFRPQSRPRGRKILRRLRSRSSGARGDIARPGGRATRYVLPCILNGSVQDRRAAYEAELAKQRREKAMEQDRIRALQERAMDVRADQDALRAKRGQVILNILRRGGGGNDALFRN